MTTTNRQFIKLTLHGEPFKGAAPVVIAVSRIASLMVRPTEEWTTITEDNGSLWHVKETPEQIYAMLNPLNPAALVDEYEKLANIATNVKFRLTETLCKHIPRGFKVDAGVLAADIEIVCKEITDLGADAKRKANN